MVGSAHPTCLGPKGGTFTLTLSLKGEGIFFVRGEFFAKKVRPRRKDIKAPRAKKQRHQGASASRQGANASRQGAKVQRCKGARVKFPTPRARGVDKGGQCDYLVKMRRSAEGRAHLL
jgi:hypothetical protein